MEFIEKKDYEQVSDLAAEIFIEEIKKNPQIILGLATGSTPLGLYKRLIKSYQNGEISFAEVQSFNLDEYQGLAPDHPGSYSYYMENNFFSHINIKRENARIPCGLKSDCGDLRRPYDQLIEKLGGIDLLLLGVGENGHIAFNEPATELLVDTHVVNLTPETINVNSRFFNNINEMPTQAVTMGMGSIMRARKIVLLITGAKKKPVVDRLLNERTVTTEFPVSFMHVHPDVTVIYDEAARK